MWQQQSLVWRTYLGIVTHLVLQFCVVIAFSSSSSWAVFFNFFTRLFTAFSHHFSSWPFCSPLPAPLWPVVVFFHPSSLFTTGGVNGKMEDIFPGSESPEDPTQRTPRTTVWALALMRAPLVTSEWQAGNQYLVEYTQKRWTPWKKVTHRGHY